MNEGLIYLDYCSTTPVDERVLDEMLPYLKNNFGNAASRNHPYGWRAASAVDKARAQVAQLIQATEKEIIFTSGATEGINLAIKGVFESNQKKGNHIITAKTEHKAVLDVCQKLETQGSDVTYLDVDEYGRVDTDLLQSSITDKTLLVSVMWANNETGTLQPIKEIAEICQQRGILFMSDATQAVGKINVDVKDIPVDILTFSAHKYYGPKGVGVCYIRNKTKVAPLLHGGGHERGNRSGTLNVPGIVGMGMASEIAKVEMSQNADHCKGLISKLEKDLLDIEATFCNSHLDDRLPNVTNITTKFVDSETLIDMFNHTLAVSSGSACTSASLDPSHVLLAQGLSKHMAESSIRYSVGPQTTEEEIKRAVDLVKKGINHIRSESAIWERYKEGKDVKDLL